MTKFKLLFPLLITTSASLLVAQAVIPPGTGIVKDGALDQAWSIVGLSGQISADPSVIQGVPEGGAESPIVTIRGNGWFNPITGGWIGPAANEGTAAYPASCCTGTVTYEFQWLVADPSSEKFVMTIYSDGVPSVSLNHTTIYNLPNNPGPGTPIALTIVAGFVPGLNLIDIAVANTDGGTTGLYVVFSAVGSGTGTGTGAIGTDSSNGQYHTESLDEPVDAASGQYYASFTDFALGGRMNLGFARYYSSQLSKSIAATSLGANWMSNFDSQASIGGSSAKVLLFGGKVVTFNLSGGTWQLASPLDVVYQFIQSGTNYQLLDPGARIIYTFSSTGALTSISDRNGNTVTVTQGANGPTQITDGAGRTLTLTYTGSNLIKIVDQAGRAVTFAYTSGALTSGTDYYNQTSGYNYNSTGLMLAFHEPSGNVPASQTYDSSNRVITQRALPGTDGSAFTAKLAYDGVGGTTKTDGLGNVTKYVSSSAGNLTQVTNALGATSVIAYDAANRRTSITDSLGHKISYTYHPQAGFIQSVTDPLGNTTTLTYTAQAQSGFTFYNLTSVQMADGVTSSWTYDANGNVLSTTSRNGATKKFTYDSSGDTLTLVDGLSNATTLTWNADNTVASIADSLGNKRTFAYDATKRMTSTVDFNGGKTSYVLDKSTSGPQMVVIPPVSGENYSYNDNGNRLLQTEVSSLGAVYTSNYSALDQLLSVTDTFGNKASYNYDGDSRLTSISNFAGESVTLAYDAVGRVTSASDPNGTRYAFTYNTEGQPVTIANGAGQKSQFAYDAAGREASYTTADGNVYQTAYDKLGFANSFTNPLGQASSVTHDAAGMIHAVTLPGGISASVTRDAVESIVGITTANGNTWTIARDARQRITKLTDPLGQATSLTYTGNMVTGAMLPLGTVAITNDADGRMLSQKFSDGTTFTNTFDANGALLTANGVTIVRDKEARPASINGIAIAMDGEGKATSFSYANGKAIAYAYDGSGRLSSISDWLGGKTTFTYDAASRVTGIAYPNGITNTYTYDADNNVIKITQAGAQSSLASISLTRDAVGKITAADRNLPVAPVLTGSTQQFTYNTAGENVGATYDSMGRATAENGRTYTWNLASQLTGFKDGTNSGAFTYDGLGEIASSTATGAEEDFVFNYATGLPSLAIVRKAAADLRYYVYAPSGVLLYSIEASDGSRHFYHFDEVGNTTFLTDDKGAVTDSYAVTPYGEIAAHAGTTENPFTFQGAWGVMQVGSGLYYMRDRYYDATAANFLSRDPEMNLDPLSSEPYTYASGNPLLYTDPMGSWNLFSAIGSVVSGAVNAVANVAKAAVTDVVNTVKAVASAVTHVVTNVVAAVTQPAASKSTTAVKVTPANTTPAATRNTAAATIAKSSGPTLVATTTCSVSACSQALVGSGISTLSKIAGSATVINTNGSKLGATVKEVPQPAPVVSNDGGSVVSNDGGSVVSNDGGSAIPGLTDVALVTIGGSAVAGCGKGAPVIATDSAGLISQDGNGLISQDGNGLISQDGNGLIGNSGSTLIGNSGSTLIGASGSTLVAH